MFLPAVSTVKTGDLLLFYGSLPMQQVITAIQGDFSSPCHVAIAVVADKVSGTVIFGDTIELFNQETNTLLAFESNTGDLWDFATKQTKSGTRLCGMKDLTSDRRRWYTHVEVVPMEIERDTDFYVKVGEFIEMKKNLEYEPSFQAMLGTALRADFAPKSSSKICSELAMEYLQFVGLAPTTIVPASVMPIDFDKRRSNFLSEVALGEPKVIYQEMKNSQEKQVYSLISVWGVASLLLLLNSDIY